MSTRKRDLFLITGIPGTGKTTFGATLAEQFGFAHSDLETQQTFSRLSTNPAQLIAEIVNKNWDNVVTWGFAPDHTSANIVSQFKNSGFKLIWFDGNRPAALQAFTKRGTVPEMFFYLQMYRIEASKIVDIIKPAVINPFDSRGDFKSTVTLLEELRGE